MDFTFVSPIGAHMSRIRIRSLSIVATVLVSVSMAGSVAPAASAAPAKAPQAILKAIL
jgi:hypothetical protein